MLLAVILLPMITGLFVPLIKWKKDSHRELFIETLVIINTILVWYIILGPDHSPHTLVSFTGGLTITFCADGLGVIFAGLVSTLWPLATLYAFEYMTKEEHESVFFMFYTMTYGVTLGIALADNILTMYFFYELLTIVTVPLVMHTLSRKAILAGRKYMYYSLGGAAFAFIGMIFVIIYGITPEFTLGGVLDMSIIGDKTNVLLLIYVLAFFGFGVKAAVCPFNSWLPDAGVAPTPVTALLHAVAVVKSGAFAIFRLTYYCFGAEFLRGTWAQYVTMAATMFTIVYGCSRAVKETHLKRRLAYSTISNLSYILFGVTMMSPLGMVAGLSHMLMHAVMKICSFFCAGSIMHQTEREYINEMDGLGYKMPQVYGIFAISGLALMGVPGLAGFVSKWNLASAAVESGMPLAYVGIVCLLVSAVLTAIYMMSFVIRGFFPVKDFDHSINDGIKDPNWKMLLPLYIFVAFMLYFGLHSTPIMEVLCHVAGL
ncbi:MAG: proton-conducting membrane transporter [Lachnospiraceae bacterium]|nr:proton-conducting membrane transporter [Candidatus Colinaster scatohippi]